jgi:hypothetical protein
MDYAVRERPNQKLVVRCENDRATGVKVVTQTVEKVMPRMGVLAKGRFIEEKNRGFA